MSSISLSVLFTAYLFKLTRRRHIYSFTNRCRPVNESNVQRTVREPFGGKFVYVRSFNKRANMNKKFRTIS
ncbi:hypothetical protein HanIR_Chr11g0553031 [Helianthus annuus]|nr:hypothetical protein HanIR_Chr11g0553031 [Helianthus annuus]